MRDKEKDAAQMAIKRQRMLEAGFSLFSQRGIESVSMPDVAKACGYGIATLYRYFDTKLSFVVAVSAWAWEQYLQGSREKTSSDWYASLTAAQMFEVHLEFFVDLYRNHKDLLRFNQFFNGYLQGEGATKDQVAPYIEMVGRPREHFHTIYAQALRDKTLRTDVTEEELFTSTLHIMLAVATRYAVGLVYTPSQWSGAEAELLMVKRMLMQEYVLPRGA